MQNLSTFYIQGLREAPTIAKLIEPLLRESGLNKEDMNSIEEEFIVYTKLGAVAIDRCLKKNGKPWIFLQAKPVGKAFLFKVDYKKTFEAASKQEVPYVVFTDGNSWEFYSVLRSGLEFHSNIIWQIELVRNPQKFSEIVQFLQNLLNGRDIANG